MAEEPSRGGGVLRVLFWGSPLFALPSLRALSEEGHDIVGVVTQPDRPWGRGRRLRPSPVKEVAEDEGFPVLTPDRPRGPEFLRRIEDLGPEISVVVAYGHILVPEVLSVPRDGSINVHASLLPELRGAAPVHWAILRGHTGTGISIMRMVEAMDAGPVIFQTPERIRPDETSTELSTRLSEVGAEALIEALALLSEGAVQEEEQDHNKATYAPKVDREMARVDWHRTAEELGWHLRGLDSVPGAWSSLGGTAVKLFQPSPEPEFTHGALPGTVLRAGPEEGVLVACGSGAIRIGEIQSSGKKRMSSSAWLLGHPLPEGTRFE
ncbi:MAG: methionyl-tRNA formyltransferase [Gemmatimonadetes bacterium]|nr:methionyl-tRNA formyltransferase [Gemmatimonadota bacterium]NNM04634.1 methionyl-tRNA formyltransferase [Gemmatimonadota bacterium]